ncbi:MAG: DNA polymerase III subunit alpha [Lachnospiraceae bacterium]|nr:DNA polymerase III subunit alpha [Lachnospiraceae bacterium]
MSFVHLHVHTEYSLLDGSNKIKEYVRRVKELGMTAAAITDHGVMFGVIDFYREAKAQGINPIIGCELYVAPHSRFDRKVQPGEDRYYHLILLAENDKGYENLMKIVSIGYVDGFYYKPRVDFETIERYHEGLICLSACVAGEVPRLIQRGRYEEAKECALRYEACFGKDNYFLELQDHGLPIQKDVNTALLRIHQETGIGLVATNDCHYTYKEDDKPHDVLLCIQTGKKIQDEDRLRYEGGQYYVKSEEEMRSLFPYAGEALDNTQRIADRCHVEIEFGVLKLPHYDVPEGYDAYGYLRELCFKGLKERYGDRAKEVKPDLEHELEIISAMKYVDYFLIVWDFIAYARSQGIPVGPGRGSAAGSLVAYCLGITNVDPVRYSLVFERFLNPERVTMPDIDVDFCVERRGEVIDYVVRKYGEECVTQIVTFGTLKAKGVIRDVGRVLDIPYAFVDQIARMIPDERPGIPYTIDRALEINKELKDRYDQEEEVRRIIDLARPLEGLPRQTGMHPAGVVIAERPMDEFVPLARSKEGNIVTQFTMTTIEELGLLKMDFLGLRTLTVLADAVNMIRDNHGISIDIDHIPFDDGKVYESIASGICDGVFQLESEGMQNFMKELAPSSLEDIIAGISLYRPGPMDFIPNYLKGKNNQDEITYRTPELEPILSPTYGCIVYQEQVMQIVRDLAGYSMGQSDNVRRAMSKKKLDVMQKERRRFVYGDEADGVKGCLANGISEEVADHIFDEMIDFAKYAFNKAHAASYAVVAYQTAYLKYYYPAEFFAALMTSVLDSTVKITRYIHACRNMGLELLPPDVNTGGGQFLALEKGIHYGMYAVRGVGMAVADSIVAEREKNGPFSTLEEFITRMEGRDLNRRAIENLIKAGALDCLEGNRRQKMYAFPQIADAVSKDRRKTTPGQMSLFEMMDDGEADELLMKLPDVEEFDKAELLAYEKEVLGIYISGHPLEEDAPLMQKNTTAVSTDFMWDPQESEKLYNRQSVVVGGMVVEKKLHFTKNNQAMAFVTIEDLYGTVEILVFPRTFDRYRQYLEPDRKVFVAGTVSLEDEKDSKLIADRIFAFEDTPLEVWIQFMDMEDYRTNKERLNRLLSQNRGEDEVVVYLKDSGRGKRLAPRFNVSADPSFRGQLKQAFGENNVRLRRGKIRI